MDQRKISLIAALSTNRVIGYRGRLPWTLPGDHAHFRMVTARKPMIMGRLSAESEDALYSDTLSVVLSSRKKLDLPWPHMVASNLSTALRLCEGYEEVFVIGGERVFQEAMPLATQMYLTRVDGMFGGDAFFPAIDKEAWLLTRERCFDADESHSHAFCIQHWIRKG